MDFRDAELRLGRARGGAAYTAWGRVATSGFETEGDDVPMDGFVTSGLVGFDAEWERLLAGVMLSHSTGEADNHVMLRLALRF